MSTTVDIVGRLEAAGFNRDQALAILSASEERFVTRDYLDSKLGDLLMKLVLAMLAVAGLALAVARAIFP